MDIDFFLNGGPAMAVLALLSFVLFAMAFFLFLQMRNQRGGNALVRQLQAEVPGPGGAESFFFQKTRTVRFALQWLARLANLSTLTGLLGTVIGIRKSFMDLEKTGHSGPETLASGIHQAVSTTIVGLFLAIIALVFYYYFRDRFTTVREDYFSAGETLMRENDFSDE